MVLGSIAVVPACVVVDVAGTCVGGSVDVAGADTGGNVALGVGKDTDAAGHDVVGGVFAKVVEGGGVVMMVSGGQVLPLPWKVTSARCTQSGSGKRKNSTVSISFRIVLAGKHTLTRESQEVMVEVVVPMSCTPASKSLIVCTSIPQSGQLNITTSTLSNTLLESFKSKVMLVPRVVVCSVSS